MVGPTTLGGPDLDVEIVARWLASNRDRVVAFDPGPGNPRDNYQGPRVIDGEYRREDD